MMQSDAQTIADLKATIADQQEEIWQLRRVLALAPEFNMDLGLTRTQMRLFRILVKYGSISNEMGEAYFNSEGRTADALNLFRVHVHNMRKRLRDSGIEVRNTFGTGYFLDAETLARVRKLMMEKPNGLAKPADDQGPYTGANGHAHAGGSH